MTEIEPAPARRSVIGTSVEKLAWLCAIIFPYWLVGLFLRLVMARLFFLLGQTKIEGPRIPIRLDLPGFPIFDFSVALPREITAATFQRFETQHANLPIPPDLAAYLVSYGELVLPVCLALGFATRFAALALALMTVGLTLYVSPELWWPAHVYWLAILITLVSRGAGAISIDALLHTLYRREQTMH